MLWHLISKWCDSMRRKWWLILCACVGAADVNEDQSLSDSSANSRYDFYNSHLNNIQTITVPTTTTQAATETQTKNCRGPIQKRAHTLDDFMEGKRKRQQNLKTSGSNVKSYCRWCVVLIRIIRIFFGYVSQKRKTNKEKGLITILKIRTL